MKLFAGIAVWTALCFTCGALAGTAGAYPFALGLILTACMAVIVPAAAESRRRNRELERIRLDARRTWTNGNISSADLKAIGNVVRRAAR